MTTIFFGSIGSIVETSEIQRKAFNKAFQKYGLDWYWSVGNYINMIQKPGGIKRIKQYSKSNLSKIEIMKIYNLKIKYFNEYCIKNLKPRSGVVDVIKYSKDNKIKIGFITTTSKETIDIIKNNLSEHIKFDKFDIITYDKHSKRRKPYPDIYDYAISELRSRKSNTLAIEDTLSSVQSARSANIKTIFFPGEYAIHNNSEKVSSNIFEDVRNFFEKS